MIPEVVLHIGMEKTGSSSIQQVLHGYDDGQTIYAPFEWVNHSLPLQVLFKPIDQQSPGLRAQGLDEARFASLREKAQAQLDAALKTDRQRLIISAEGVLSLKPRQHKALKRSLVKHCEKLRVLAYVREPLSYASSSFQQGLKAGAGNFRVPVQNFESRLGRVFQVYGEQRIELVYFDPKSFPNGSVVQDFSARVGVDCAQLDDQRANESMAMYAAAALFLWNRDGANSTGSEDRFAARLQIIRLLLSNSQKRKTPRAQWARLGKNTKQMDERGVAKFRFSKALVHSRIDANDVKWIEDRLGVPLMPKELTEADIHDDYGVRSEEDFLQIGEAAYWWLAPLLRQFELSSPEKTTVSAMDTLFAHFIEKANAREGEAART